MKFDISELIVISPIFWLLLISVIPVAVKTSRGGQEMNPFTSLTYSIFGIVGAIGLTLTAVKEYWTISRFNFIEAIYQNLIVDGISVWGCYIVLMLAGFSLFLLHDSKQTNRQVFSENIFLFLISTIGMILVIMANDLLLMFLAFELVFLTFVFLMWINKGFIHYREVLLKFFLINSLFSLLFLFGLVMIYGGVGSTNLQVVGELAAQLYQSNSLFRLGVLFVVIGFAGKAATVPFHSWGPDVEQGLPTPLTTMMTTALRVACFIAFLRFFIYSDFYDLADDRLVSFLQWISVLSILIGNTAALLQDHFKRLLAYTGIGHMGYVMATVVAAAMGSDSDAGVTSLIFYFLTYTTVLMGAYAFMVCLEKDNNEILLISDFRGLVRSNPYSAIALSVVLISLAGLPPSIGFFAKFYVLATLMEQGFYWLSSVVVIGSVLGLFCYLKPVIYLVSDQKNERPLLREPVYAQSILFACAVGALILGLLSSDIFLFVQSSIINSL